MGLRFASYTRVSTEAQEQRGHSLRTQVAGIEAAVKKMRGTETEGEIVARYGEGQESGTAGHARPQFDRMLDDAAKRKFDAVIVYDLSRWTRDPVKGGYAAEILRTNGIRLFEKDVERDLFNETDELLMDMTG